MERPPNISWLIILIAAVLGIVLLYPWILYWLNPVLTYEIRGQFGDSYGMLNTMFSGLAFVVLIYTIYLQREDLKLTIKDLNLTREELKKSAEAQTKLAELQEKMLENEQISQAPQVLAPSIKLNDSGLCNLHFRVGKHPLRVRYVMFEPMYMDDNIFLKNLILSYKEFLPDDGVNIPFELNEKFKNYNLGSVIFRVVIYFHGRDGNTLVQKFTYVGGSVTPHSPKLPKDNDFKTVTDGIIAGKFTKISI